MWLVANLDFHASENTSEEPVWIILTRRVHCTIYLSGPGLILRKAKP